MSGYSRGALRISASLLILGSATTCSSKMDRTEVIVVVDTDLEIPGELSTIRVETTSPTDEVQEAIGSSLSIDNLPASVGLAYLDGPLGPFEVRVVGLSGAASIIERRARVTFVPGRTLVVEMHLLRACLGAVCEQGQTCGSGGCRAVDIDGSEYSDYTGSLPTLEGDAGVSGGDADAPDSDVGARDADTSG